MSAHTAYHICPPVCIFQLQNAWQAALTCCLLISQIANNNMADSRTCETGATQAPFNTVLISFVPQVENNFPLDPRAKDSVLGIQNNMVQRLRLVLHFAVLHIMSLVSMYYF
jgi:hypothetical protein